MYSDLIRIGDDALAANQRLRGQTADLQARTVALMLRYYRHRLPLLIGASDASDEHERVCVVCRSTIKSGEGRYRVGETEFHPECFKFWMTMPFARRDDLVE